MTHEQNRARRAAIVEEIKAGTSVETICKKWNVSVSLVQRACAEKGIRCTGLSRLSDRTYEIIADLVNTKDSQTEIARKHKVSKQYVNIIRKKLKQYGIV